MRGIPASWRHTASFGDVLEARRISRRPMRKSAILLFSLAALDVLATILALMGL